MANPNDSDIIGTIVELPTALQLPYLLRWGPMIQDDAHYWCIVAACWVNAEVCTPNLAHWRMLFTAPRPRRWKLMKKRDRAVWRGLPETVRAYRAIRPGEDMEEAAISWSLSREVAERLGDGKREIITMAHRKLDVIAYFDRRAEKEIIVVKQSQLPKYSNRTTVNEPGRPGISPY